MKPNHLLFLRSLLLIPAYLLSLSGCGGGTMKPTTTTTTSSTTTTTTTSTTTTTACSYNVAPQGQLELPNQQNSQMAQNQAANFRYTVTTGSGCAWTTTSGSTWLRFANPTGAGDATINLNWDANTTGADRTTSVTIGGQTRSVLQHQPNWNGFP